MAAERTKRERPINPRQNWVNNVASKYFDLVPKDKRSSLDELFGASDSFWKAGDMSAKGTARALCMGDLGMKGVSTCARPFDKSLRVSSKPEGKSDARAFLDELEVPRPSSLRKLAQAAPDSPVADLLRRIEAAQAGGLAPPKPRKVREPKAPKPKVERRAKPKGSDKKRLFIVEDTKTGDTMRVTLDTFVEQTTAAQARQLRALKPGEAMEIQHERYTREPKVKKQPPKKEPTGPKGGDKKKPAARQAASKPPAPPPVEKPKKERKVKEPKQPKQQQRKAQQSASSEADMNATMMAAFQNVAGQIAAELKKG